MVHPYKAFGRIHQTYENLKLPFLIVSLEAVFAFLAVAFVARIASSPAMIVILAVLSMLVIAGESMFWFVLTGIFHYTARLLGGNGRFQSLMILTGFSKVPLLLINTALLIASPYLREAIPIYEFMTLLIIFSLCGRMWESWLSVLSVSINHGLSKRASAVCVLLPEVALVIIYTIVFLVLLGGGIGVR